VLGSTQALEGEKTLGLAPRRFPLLFSPLLCVNSLIYNTFSISNINCQDTTSKILGGD